MKRENFRKKRMSCLCLILFVSTSIYAQKYKKTYQQNINYQTRSQNGKDISFDFACKYDALMGEPLFSSRTKKTREGDFIMYNGKKYTVNDLGEDVFNKVKPGVIDVSFDIYQGNQKITTVYLENEISVSFIPGSPDWKDLWPGISEERAKAIWKEGYSIRNAKITNISFNGFYAIDSHLRKIVEDEEKRIAEEVAAKEEAKQKAKKEAEEEAEEQAKKEEEDRIENEKENEQKENDEAEERDEKEKEAQRMAEEAQKRKEAEERRKQEKIKAYEDRIENQNKENMAIATSAAASSTGLLFLLGGIIYDKMGLPADDLYTGSNFHFNFDIGYGLSVFPLAYASERTGIDYNTGEETLTADDIDKTSITINLRLGMKMGYETEYGGGQVFGYADPGFLPLLTDFNLSYGYGGEVFAGHKNAKLYGRYEIGTHNFTSNNWIDAEEIGEGGKTSTTYRQIRAGLKFTYYRNNKTAKRDHLTLGIIENYFDEDSAKVFSIRETPDESLLNIIDVEQKYIATGYFFEWKRDHTHKLYVELFPNYPVTGEQGGSSEEGKFFFQFGFIRSIDSFF